MLVASTENLQDSFSSQPGDCPARFSPWSYRWLSTIHQSPIAQVGRQADSIAAGEGEPAIAARGRSALAAITLIRFLDFILAQLSVCGVSYPGRRRAPGTES